MKKYVLAAAMVSVALFCIFPQPRTPAAPAPGAASGQTVTTRSWSELVEERLQLAISSIEYPVTPGDIYQLTYRESAGTIVTRQFQVDGFSLLDLGVFGKINASNMSFYQLKRNVEELISRNYTYSTPNLSIQSPGVFRVAVREGTSRIQYVTAWGLSRLSEVVSQVNMPNSSIRDIERVSRDGMSERFDLLKVRSTPGAKDPYVRPGDTVILHQAERTVELRGEVEQPGRYELVGSETLKDLVEVFGEGFTKKADLERLRIIRSSSAGGRVDYVSYPKSLEPGFQLNDGDTVIVESLTAKQSLVWFEGAVTTPIQENDVVPSAGIERPDTAADPTEEHGRFSHPIGEGKKLSTALLEVRLSILPSADLSAALLRKPGSGYTVVDLRPLLTGSDFSRDVVLTPNTVVFIPARRAVVSVSGAVFEPGFTPYFPGAPAEYYISVRGGFNPEQSKAGAFIVYDQYGQKRRKSDPVQPGDSIFVRSNALGYNLERRLPIWISTISLAVTTVSVILQLQQND